MGVFIVIEVGGQASWVIWEELSERQSVTPAPVYNSALWPGEHPKSPIQTVRFPSKCSGQSLPEHTSLLLILRACAVLQKASHAWPRANKLLLSSCPVQNRCGINPHLMIWFRNVCCWTTKWFPDVSFSFFFHLIILSMLNGLYLYSTWPLRALLHYKPHSPVHTAPLRLDCFFSITHTQTLMNESGEMWGSVSCPKLLWHVHNGDQWRTTDTPKVDDCFAKLDKMYFLSIFQSSV